jgi:hypothetical protein
MGKVSVELRKYEVPVGIDIRKTDHGGNIFNYSWRRVDRDRTGWVGEFDSEDKAVADAARVLGRGND